MAGNMQSGLVGSVVGSASDVQQVISRELQRLRLEFPNWGFLVLHHT